jgi:hypothetical protein
MRLPSSFLFSRSQLSPQRNTQTGQKLYKTHKPCPRCSSYSANPPYAQNTRIAMATITTHTIHIFYTVHKESPSVSKSWVNLNPHISSTHITAHKLTQRRKQMKLHKPHILKSFGNALSKIQSLSFFSSSFVSGNSNSLQSESAESHLRSDIPIATAQAPMQNNTHKMNAHKTQTIT